MKVTAPISEVREAPSKGNLASKKVLILNSYESNAPVFLETDKGVLDTLRSGGIPNLNQFFESLDLRRNPGPGHRRLLVEQMRMRYGHRKPDMIITIYPEALEFVMNDCRDIFRDVPIIALYLPKSFDQKETARPIIRHFPTLDVAGTLEIAVKLVPGAKRVYVVGGTHEVDRRVENQARRDWKKWEGQLEFLYLSHLPLEEILAAVSNASPGSIILALAFSQDVTGRIQTTPEVAQRLSQVSTAPIFGILDSMLGQGIIGGSLLSFGLIGTKAGQLALDIFGDTRTPENTPVILEVPSVPMFDWRQLRRWNISEAALPHGSVIANKELTFWDFRYHIMGLLAFCLAETALIFFFIVQRRRKRVAEESLRQKNEEIDQFFKINLDLLCIANTEGYFLRLNPAWERVLGYTREELMAKQFLDFIHPDDLDSTREAVSSLESQQKMLHFENRYRCKDGTYRWLQWNSAPVGNMIYAAARDITESKEAEEALGVRLRFEHMLSSLSARFVNIPSDRVDSEIEDGLRQILEFFQVDHCALLRTLPGKTSWLITHVASSDFVPPVPAGIELPRSIYPWAYEKLAENHEVMSISRLDDLPAEANVDRQTCLEWGLRSYVNIPILIGESVDFIHVSSIKSERVWPAELFPRLRLLGEIFVNALQLKEAHEASRESERILRQNESDLRGLAGRLIRAQEEERSRLARELHDDLAQRLAVFAIDVGKLEQQLKDPPAVLQEELHEMRNDIVKISQDVHSLSRQLHPSILDDLGLIKAIESECTNFSRREGIEIVFRHEDIPTAIPKDISLSLYRIIQEGLRNISKHACAEHISVFLKGTDHDVLLSVQDDGIGFDWAEVRKQPGLGLSSMRERTRLINGELSIQTQPEKGTVISIRVPLTLEGE
jgi:PAS domain S-box-containing protein